MDFLQPDGSSSTVGKKTQMGTLLMDPPDSIASTGLHFMSSHTSKPVHQVAKIPHWNVIWKKCDTKMDFLHCFNPKSIVLSYYFVKQVSWYTAVYFVRSCSTAVQISYTGSAIYSLWNGVLIAENHSFKSLYNLSSIVLGIDLIKNLKIGWRSV